MGSNFKFASRPDVGIERWNYCSDKFPDAWLWHRWEAIDAYATWPGTTDASFALLDPVSSDPVALVPLHRILGPRPIRNWAARFESTGGPAYAETLSARQRGHAERDVRSTLLSLAAQSQVHRIELAMAPLAPARQTRNGINPLAMLGCADASTQSWILDLSGRDEEALWQNMEHRVRKSVNKAERNGVRVRIVVAGDFPDFLRLHKQAAKRNGLPVKPNAYFETIFCDFIANDRAIGFCAQGPDGQTIAIHVFGIYKQGALYWVVASNPEALRCGANDLVQWHAIRTFAKRGITYYECGEAFPGTPDGKLRRISDFKKGFGGDLAPYYRGNLNSRPRVAAVLSLLRAIRGRGMRGDT
ncbi:MAG: hypothetical protein CL573_06495 [Alphaproteobacteria bacterium]|nr:hypothetical protein [Alphaproteobacteria bacterium]